MCQPFVVSCRGFAFLVTRVVALSCLAGTLICSSTSNLWAQAEVTAEKDDAVVVELIDAGSTPRRELRFAPKPGDEQTAVMTMDMQMKMTIQGQQAPQQKLPAQRITMKVVVDDVKPNGNISFHFVYTDIKVVDDPNNPSPAAAQIQQMVAPMIGMTGKGISSNRGITLSGSVDVPPNAPAPIKQQLDGMKDAINRLSSPVPEEAIGVGARWSVSQRIDANGMKMEQKSIHELTELGDDGFAMTITISQTAGPQQVKNDALPPNVKLSLTSLKTSGKGSSRFVIGSVLPLRASVSAESEVDMLMEIGGNQQRMTTETTIKTSFEPPAN